jgi:hypothetical protein
VRSWERYAIMLLTAAAIAKFAPVVGRAQEVPRPAATDPAVSDTTNGLAEWTNVMAVLSLPAPAAMSRTTVRVGPATTMAV